MRLFLKPNDTFFFRDGRPFTRGEQSEGYSMETPLPSTVMGALRTAYIAFCGDMAAFAAAEMESVIGTKKSLTGASIHIKGVFVGGNDGTLYYPTPRDLVSKKKCKDTTLFPLVESQDDTFASNSELSTHLTWDNAAMQVEHPGQSISSNILRKYLLGDKESLKLEDADFIRDEPKVGITRNKKTLAAAESMLYRINMKRFRDSSLGFVVDVEGIDQFPKKGLIKLGGEGKGFTYKETCHEPKLLSDDDLQTLCEKVDTAGKFKLYFATHAIFDKGWNPEALHPDIELITAAVGNYVTVGGWDVAQGRPKGTCRAVPAGSVYYFRLINGASIEAILDALHYKNIGDQRTQEGFGLAYVGVV